jgi:hypothetical protein
VYLIHEGFDEEDAPARTAENVLRRQRVGNGIRVEAGALIRDADDQCVGVGFKRGCDVLGSIVCVAVEDGVNRGLSHRHGDVGDGVFIESGALSKVLCGSFYRVDALEVGTERERGTACGGIGQSSPLNAFARTTPDEAGDDGSLLVDFPNVKASVRLRDALVINVDDGTLQMDVNGAAARLAGVGFGEGFTCPAWQTVTI